LQKEILGYQDINKNPCRKEEPEGGRWRLGGWLGEKVIRLPGGEQPDCGRPAVGRCVATYEGGRPLNPVSTGAWKRACDSKSNTGLSELLVTLFPQ
jgi:hypothetical protein